jgi:hypothetical protein
VDYFDNLVRFYDYDVDYSTWDYQYTPSLPKINEKDRNIVYYQDVNY